MPETKKTTFKFDAAMTLRFQPKAILRSLLVREIPQELSKDREVHLKVEVGVRKCLHKRSDRCNRKVGAGPLACLSAFHLKVDKDQ